MTPEAMKIAIAEACGWKLHGCTDEECYYPIGIWPTLAEAVAYVDGCGDDPNKLASDGIHDDYCRVEIRERQIGPSTHGKKVFEREWVQDYDDATDEYEWRVKPTPPEKQEK
jgi:hypothetical protein